MVTSEETCKASYNKHFENSAYSSWEYAPVIQRDVLREGEDWRTFLETSREKRKKWPRKRKDELKRRTEAIPEEELRKILAKENGDCTKFANAVVNDMPSNSFTYMGDGEHTLAYGTIDKEILIIDSMYKESIKFSADKSPIWTKDRKINIKNSARSEQKKYYPENDKGLILKGIVDPSTLEVWRVNRSKGTSKVECFHDENCAHKPFERLSNWQAAIRQSLFLWTMKGQCVILFRNRTEEGPGFDGQIDFRAGEKFIILSQREFRNGDRYHKKVIFEFKKEKESQEEEDELLEAFLEVVQQFLTSSTYVDRSRQFESTKPIFQEMILKMKCLWGPPRFKETRETPC